MSAVIMNLNYGPVREGVRYEVITEGRDWYLLRCRGRSIYVPSRWARPSL